MDGITGGRHNPKSARQIRKDGFSHINPRGSTEYLLSHIFVTCELRSAWRVINFRQFQ